MNLVERLNRLSDSSSWTPKPGMLPYGWNGPLSVSDQMWRDVKKRYEIAGPSEMFNRIMTVHAFCFLRFSAKKWWTDTAEGIMQTIEEGHHDRGPILADALEDAGCEDPYLFEVLRATE